MKASKKLVCQDVPSANQSYRNRSHLVGRDPANVEDNAEWEYWAHLVAIILSTT